MNPISERADRERIRARFQSELPLPGFAVVDEFLKPELADRILSEALEARYGTWCGYSPTGRLEDLRAHFREPDDRDFFVTVHQRPLEPVPTLDEVGRAFGSPEMIAAMSEMTGLELKSLRPFGSEILTRWPEGSFLEAHTDAGRPDAPTQLVISLSLTRSWREEYGGSTVFAWQPGERHFTTWPRFNSAVLFKAFAGSVHWVNPVNENAPADRFTFTLHYL